MGYFHFETADRACHTGGMSKLKRNSRPADINRFSRKMENHAAAVALNYFAYNFIKIHRTLRVSPAMAAGVTDRLWSVEDLVTPSGSPTNSGGRKERHEPTD